MRQYTAKIVGFAFDNCKVCHGTGRNGFIGPMEKGVVNVCICVVAFETATLLKEAEDAKLQQQRDCSLIAAQEQAGNNIPSGPRSGDSRAERRE